MEARLPSTMMKYADQIQRALAVLSFANFELSDLGLALAFGAFVAALGLASDFGLALAFGFGFAVGAGGSASRVMRSWSKIA